MKAVVFVKKYNLPKRSYASFIYRNTNMHISLSYGRSQYSADLSKPIDLSLPLSNTDENPIAWYLDKPVIEPVRNGDWIGSVSKGSSTNFNNIGFNPHGHGTHTECLGHITRDFHSVNQHLASFFFMAELISATPEIHGDDRIVTLGQIRERLKGKAPEAVIIRTLPNAITKKSAKYSNTNPPFLAADAANYLREAGVQHLLIDMPSVDREHDEGKLLAHKAFWNVRDVDDLNTDARFGATITELVFVPDEIADGTYLLNLQTAPFENDASPSRPVLYALS